MAGIVTPALAAMPRTARFVIPGIPFHVTQRGVDRMAIFRDDSDRRHFCGLLRDATRLHGVAVNAWTLMHNHVHLLLTPKTADGLWRAMKRCTQRYASAFNSRHGRIGPLVQGRFHSSPVGTRRYFLEVVRYIELNPVRAGMVRDATHYPWTSAHVHLDHGTDSLVDVHEEFLMLGPTPAERARVWNAWLRAGIRPRRLQSLREHLRRGRPYGDGAFRAAVVTARERDPERGTSL